MEHYLCISVGPVQDLIASARRCRDLWYGSHLLSEISKAAALGIVDSGVAVGNLVFPAPKDKEQLRAGSDLSVANRIVAIVADPEAAATAARQACQQRLREMADKAFKHFDDRSLDREGADRQIDDLLEFYWVAVPLTDYKTARQQAERLLAARKNTRCFQPVSWGSPSEKSSLDGQREAILNTKKIGAHQMRRFGLRPGEHLCGIGALKRLGSMIERKAALSTSHVASGTWLRSNSLEDSQALESFRQSLQRLVDEADLYGRDGRIDGHLLYEDRLLSYVDEAAHDDARRALKQLYSHCKGRPSPYYCILLADGDRMGAAIDCLDRNEHRQLTLRLSEFASHDVPEIVTAHHGYLIYSGGDDILAMLPVDSALGCSSALARKFAEAMVKYQGPEYAPTLSVGLAVRHHMDPLNDGLAAVRRAEKAAKKERNSLAVSLDKRGGAEVLVAGQWAEIDRRLQRYADQSSKLSTGFAYELRELASRLLDGSSEMIVREAARIVKRKSGPDGSLRANEIDQLSEDIRKVGALKVAEQLIVSRFFGNFGGHAPAGKGN